jgi:hypothetical protein
MAVEIGAKLSVDAGASKQTVHEVTQELKLAKEELKQTTIGSKEYTDANKKIKEAQDKLNPSLSEGNGHFGNLKEKLGSISPQAAGASESVGKFNGALNILKANPIILVITLLVGIFYALWERIKNMKVVSEGLEVAWQVLGDVMDQVANVVIKPIIATITAVSDAIGWLGDKISSLFGPSIQVPLQKTTASFTQLRSELKELDDQHKRNEISQAAANRQLAEARELATDQDVPIKERIAALKKAAEIERDILTKTQDFNLEKARKEMQILAKKMGATDEEVNFLATANAKEIAGAQEVMLAIRTVDEDKVNSINQYLIAADDAGSTLAKIATKTNKAIKAQEKQQAAADAADAKAAHDEAVAAQKARLENLRSYQQKIEKLQQEEHLANIRDSYAKEKYQLEIKLADDIRTTKLDLENKKISLKEYQALELEYRKLTDMKLKELADKKQLEEKKKTADFMIELNALKAKVELDGMKDLYQKEIATIDKQYKDKEAVVLKNEKLNHVQKMILIFLLQREYNAMLDAASTKHKQEEDSKKRKDEILGLKNDMDRLKGRNAAKFKAELDLFNQKRELEKAELIAQNATNNQIIEFDRQTAEGRKAIAKAEGSAKIELAMAYANAMSSVAEVIGKDTAAGKALSVASALISTYQGIAKGVSMGMPMGLPSVISAAATGFSAVKKILAVEVPGASTSATVPSASSVAAPLMPSPNNATTTLSDTALNSINASASRAFVVESDITNNQQRISRINRAARIG